MEGLIQSILERSPELWAIAQRQVAIWNIADVIGIAMLATALWVYFSQLLPRLEEVDVALAALVSVLVVLVQGLACLYLTYDLATNIANPNYAALKALLILVKGD